MENKWQWQGNINTTYAFIKRFRNQFSFFEKANVTKKQSSVLVNSAEDTMEESWMEKMITY